MSDDSFSNDAVTNNLMSPTLKKGTKRLESLDEECCDCECDCNMEESQETEDCLDCENDPCAYCVSEMKDNDCTMCREESNPQSPISRKCHHCQNVFKSNSEFVLHYEKYHARSENNSQEIKFVNESTIKKRKLSRKEDYRCPFCFMEFSLLRLYETHVQYCKRREKNFRCKNCLKLFSKAAMLINHLTRDHLDELIDCFVCTSRQMSSKFLASHVIMAHKYIL